MSGSKISVYSLPDLKNTTDDALPNYLNSLGFTQSHHYTDVRLALGYAAVTIAGVLFYTDWKLGWEVTRPWTLPAVIAYMVLNGAFTYWMFRVEKGTVYVGTRKGVEIEIASSASTSGDNSTDSGVPVYKVTARTRKSGAAAAAARSADQWTTTSVSAPLSSWFSRDGYFVAKPFQRFLAKGVSAVGEADPKNASASEDSGPALSIQAGDAAAGSGRQGQNQSQNFNVNISNLPEVLKHIQAQGGATKRK